MSFRFEGLEIWRRAREFSAKIHEVTATFPRQEMYALTDQINRASDATALLIAEGSGLQTNALFNHRLGCWRNFRGRFRFWRLTANMLLLKSKRRCTNGAMPLPAR